MNRRRLGADGFVLAGLFLLFTVIAWRVAMGNSDGPETGRPRRSTFSEKRGGWKAFYQILEREKVKVSRLTTSPEKGLDAASVIITGPEYGSFNIEAWDNSQYRALYSWIQDGGTLILLTDDASLITKRLRLKLDDSNDKAESSIKKSEEKNLTPLQPATFFDFMRKGIVSPDRARWKSPPPPDAIPLLEDDGHGLAGVVIQRGSGRIIAITSPGMADNEHIGLGDNARFLVQLVVGYAGTGKNGQSVAFDEFHQGYHDDTDDEKTLWRVIGLPGRMVALQLLAVILLGVYSAGRRFGLPRPRPEAARVSSEYVASLADLYRRALAGDTALEALYGSFRRDLCRILGEPPDAPAEMIAPRAAAILTQGNAEGRRALAQRLRTLMETCETRVAQSSVITVTEPAPRPKRKKGASVATPVAPPLTRTKNVRVKGAGVKDAELLTLAREIDAMRKELDLGGYADQSG